MGQGQSPPMVNKDGGSTATRPNERWSGNPVRDDVEFLLQGVRRNPIVADGRLRIVDDNSTHPAAARTVDHTPHWTASRRVIGRE